MTTPDGTFGGREVSEVARRRAHELLHYDGSECRNGHRPVCERVATYVDASLNALKACPCLHTSPCHPDCTCVDPFSSRGCARCCSYGSIEQQAVKADFLARVLDEEHVK